MNLGFHGSRPRTSYSSLRLPLPLALLGSLAPRHEMPVSEIELRERTRSTLAEFYNLLEQYAPSWYPERLRKKAKSVLQMYAK